MRQTRGGGQDSGGGYVRNRGPVAMWDFTAAPATHRRIGGPLVSRPKPWKGKDWHAREVTGGQI